MISSPEKKIVTDLPQINSLQKFLNSRLQKPNDTTSKEPGQYVKDFLLYKTKVFSKILANLAI